LILSLYLILVCKSNAQVSEIISPVAPTSDAVRLSSFDQRQNNAQ